jgi:protein-tyrosine-phosphatase
LVTEGENVKTVLFLCTGNYYRSRFAEELSSSPEAAVVAAEGVEAAEVSAGAVAEVAESASALEVAAGVDAQDAGWAGGESTA